MYDEPINVDPEIIRNLKARLAEDAARPASVKVLYKDWMDDSLHYVSIDRKHDEAGQVS